MRRTWRWFCGVLVVGLLGGGVFGAGMLVTDHLEEDNAFCIACHLHEQKYTQFHPVQGQQITLAAAHNLQGDEEVKCIDCHIGATFTDKLVVKAIAARDTFMYVVGAFQEPTTLRYALGSRTCLKCHLDGGQKPEQENAFHNAASHANMPITCYECHTVHPVARLETRFLQQQTVQPLCDRCHKEMEG